MYIVIACNDLMLGESNILALARKYSSPCLNLVRVVLLSCPNRLDASAVDKLVVAAKYIANKSALRSSSALPGLFIAV